MKKYIIKNCPCWNKQYKICISNNGLSSCEFKNCILKQIVNQCNYEITIDNNSHNIARKNLAKEFLVKFEIEEVENE